MIQRVSRASVTSGGRLLGKIGRGLLVLVGIGPDDDSAVASRMAQKIVRLRIFDDDAGRMNRSIEDVSGKILVVSQFTLYGDARKGNRPGFDGAAPPEKAGALYEELVRLLEECAGRPVETGSFGASMEVELVNDGPVTILLELEKGP